VDNRSDEGNHGCRNVNNNNEYKGCILINLSTFYKTPYFGSSGSFKVTNVDTTEKLITSACCDRQHAHAYLHKTHGHFKNGLTTNNEHATKDTLG